MMGEILMKWITNAVLITSLFWLIGHTGNALAQEGTGKVIVFESFPCRVTSAAKGAGHGTELAAFYEEMSSEELEGITGKGPGDMDRPYLTVRIILGNEIDVEQASGVTFDNRSCSTLNTQLNNLIVGRR